MPALLSDSMHAQALADLQRQRLRLELLRVAFGHGELAFEGDDLGRIDRAPDHVPERRLAGRRGDADAGRPAIHVVGDVGAFRMAGQRLDAARLGLREQRMIGQTVILQQRLQRARAAAEPQRVDRAASRLADRRNSACRPVASNLRSSAWPMIIHSA